MEKRILISLLSLFINQFALAEPIFKVKCSEVKNRGDNWGHFELFEGVIPMGVLKMMSEADIKHAQTYRLITLAPNCHSVYMIVEKQWIQKTKNELSNSESTSFPQYTMTLLNNTSSYVSGSYSVRPPIESLSCESSQVLVQLNKGDRIFDSHHEDTKIVQPGETTTLSISYHPGLFGYKIQTSCTVTYLTDEFGS